MLHICSALAPPLNDALESSVNSRTDIERKIKACQKRIDEYSMLKNNAQFMQLSEALSESGLNFDDIIKVLVDGDIDALREKANISSEDISENAEE